MRPSKPGADDTIRVLPTVRRRRPWRLLAIAATVGAVLAGSVALLLPRPQPQHASVSRSLTAPVVATSRAPAFQIETATEAAIGAHVPTSLTVFRLADNPRILVLDFASLHEQGKMLNRVAAFAEKAGLPHNRVLTDDELAAAIRERGDTVETFYFGHDYAAASLAAFFALADSEQIELNPLEGQLRALLRQEGWLAPDVAAGLISLPAVGSDPRITAAARTAILRHELSHGEFFSNPEYAAYVRNFWLKELTGEERGSVRGFLAREGYDAREEELMFNEMQAYLMFTRDPAFFAPDMVEMSEERLAELQARFLADMPAGWLKNLLASSRSAVSAR
jgi:hypothetical protein